MLAHPIVAPNVDCVGTSPRPQPQMAATTLRGYDSMTLAWSEISTPVPENSVPPTDIVDDRGSSKQRSTPKTSGVVPEGRQPEATNQAMKNPATGGTSQQATPPAKTPPKRTSSKTPSQGAHVLQSMDIPPVTDPGARKGSKKKTASQVGNGARAASSCCFSGSSFPASCPEFLELKQELAALQAQNAQLQAELAALETGSPPVPPPFPRHFPSMLPLPLQNRCPCAPFLLFRSLLTLKSDFRLLKVL
ncbi:hypothetical protein MRX96_019794 [Rhipicephalus microplus]